MHKLSNTTTTTPRSAVISPSDSRPEIVWVVDKTTYGGSILVARWIKPVVESPRDADAA